MLVDKLHFKDELVMARELQAQLVPRVLPEIGAFERVTAEDDVSIAAVRRKTA